MFIERALKLVLRKGYSALITMQGWMYLSSFEKMRQDLLSYNDLISVAHIGTRGFDSIGGAVVSTAAFIFIKSKSKNILGSFLKLVDGRNEQEKSLAAKQISSGKTLDNLYKRKIEIFDEIPGSPIAYWASDSVINAFKNGRSIGDISAPRQGLATSDNDRFLRAWHEVSNDCIKYDAHNSDEALESRATWFPYNKGGSFRKWFGNNDYLINWKNNGFEVIDYAKSLYGSPTRTIKNIPFYFRDSITWSALSGGKIALRNNPNGFIFDTKGQCIFFENDRDKASVLAFLNSIVSNCFLSFLAPTLDYNSGVVAKMPFIKANLDSSLIKKCVLTEEMDWNSYETSWNFKSLPLLDSTHLTTRLDDTYRNLRDSWQEMTDEMKRLEEENNRIFIDAYGLQDELTPDVPLEEITLTCNPYYRYGGKNTPEELEAKLLSDTMQEFIHYAVGCMFGRYSIDKPGLILANQGDTIAEYKAQVPNSRFEVDEDNVIPVLDENWFEDDIVERFQKFLRVTFGEENYKENLEFIENAIGKNLRKYFTKDFYDYHVRRFKKRPIYWMFSSPKGTFNALIYMHRYRPDTASVVLNDYLRDFRSKLEAKKADCEQTQISTSASDAEKVRATKEIDKIKLMLDELNHWEKDVLHPLATQRIEIDLDDGVKVNYPKFGAALKPIKGLEANDE